jgi:hypothetical protein
MKGVDDRDEARYEMYTRSGILQTLYVYIMVVVIKGFSKSFLE